MSRRRIATATSTYAVIAAGGTGGHVVPGLVVAHELVSRGHPADEILFVGSERGIDAQLVPAAGFPLEALPGRGIERKVSLAAAGAVLAILQGVARGIGVIRRARPRVVVVLGGYAAVPAMAASVLFRIPMIVVARDARGGLADRLAARFAKASAVPFTSTDLPRAVVTGPLVRSEVLAVDRTRDWPAARAELGLPLDRVVVAVFTGSLGSARVNAAVRALAERWADRDDVAIRHVIGRRDWDAFAADLPVLPDGGLLYQPVRYEDRMHSLLAAADIVVSRSGGSTVGELAVVGLPSILVPLPIATRDHQTLNAEALVEVGGAVRVPDAELDVDRLEDELGPLVKDPRRREKMALAARTIGRADAAAAVADLVEHAARPVLTGGEGRS
jgi:UDP-N-acetylglucosamine--N-acetylmuramyl-(pentapeptide) pyrophosphoryl-undecaprenol N-acetylglucosamine transferase